MSITKEDLKEEKLYLEKTIEEINDQLDNAGKDIFKDQDNLKKFQDYIWEDTQGFDDQELADLLYQNENKVKLLDEKALKFKRLVKVKSSPYFGSFIFNDEKFYIGITSINKDLNYFVYDWRAPISSLFYDATIGKCEYMTPDGVEKGEMTSKRQYSIEDGKLKNVFDTNLNIDDDMLQDVLSQNSSDKMKNIVNTIQKEQNQVIRDNSKSNIIVQGIAGSGKTSVALHRIAFLLYKLPYLTSGNVLIFSPNNIFSEYISNVLPDLGEDNTMQTSFHSFAETFITEYDHVESYSLFVEKYYRNVKDDYDLIRFKLSDKMKDALDDFYKYFCKAVRFMGDLEHKKKVIPKDELNELLHDRYVDKPLFERFNLIAEHLSNRYFKGLSSDETSINKKLFKISNIKKDFREIYKLFFLSKIFTKYYDKELDIKAHNKRFLNKTISYEDATPFVYLKCLLEGYPYQVAMRQVVIDEAQDYTYLQYYLVHKIFKNADFTILGDVNQTVNPFYKYDNLNILQNIFGKNSKYIELTKTYRSSPEIIEYANTILGLNHVSAIRRTNHLPVLKRSIKDLKHVGRDIKYLKDKYKSVAIITKSINEANLIYNEFKDRYTKISVISSSTKKFYTELVVTPAYLAKGLEFDACIIINNYDKDKYLYYVSVTRAQHELIIYE